MASCAASAPSVSLPVSWRQSANVGGQSSRKTGAKALLSPSASLAIRPSSPSARLADEDHRAPFGDEIGREQRADRRQSQRRLEAEVEFLDRAEEGKMRGPRRLGQARSTAVRDLLGEEDEEHVLVRPVFLLGTLDERLPRTARVSEVESLEERIEIGAHDAPRFGSARPSGSAT